MSMVYRDAGSALTNDEIDSNFRSVGWRYGGVLASPAGGTLTLTDEYNYFHISGTNGISGITDKALEASVYGFVVTLVFDGALTLTHNAAALVLPNGGNNITTAAGDMAVFVQKTAAIWECISYTKADGQPVSNTQTDDFTFSSDVTASGVIHFGTEATESTSSATHTLDFSVSNKIALTLNDSVTTLNITDPPGACGLTLRIIQDATGSRTITWPAKVLWSTDGGDEPTLSGDAADIDIVSFYFDGTNYYGSALLDFN